MAALRNASIDVIVRNISRGVFEKNKIVRNAYNNVAVENVL